MEVTQPFILQDQSLIAKLAVVSLAKIFEGDTKEREKLHEACTRCGLFYLDLVDHHELLADWQDNLKFTKYNYNQTIELKTNNDRKTDIYGYVRSVFSLSWKLLTQS
jgi:hypothetical protein